MNIKKILKESIWIYAFVFIGAVAGYFVRVLYARNFTVAEYGLFYAVFSFIFLFRPLREFGLNASQIFYMNRSLTKTEYAKAKGVFAMTLASQIVLSFIVASIIFTFRNYLAKYFFKDPIAGTVISFLLVYFILHSFVYNMSNMFGSFQKHFLFQLRDPMIIIFVLVFSLIFFKLDYKLLTMPLAHLFAGAAASVIYFLLYKLRLKELNVSAQYDWKTTKEVFVYGFAMSIGSFAWVILSYLHTTLLTWMRGLESVGYYNVILPSVQVIFLMTNPILNLLFPIATNMFHSEKKKELSALLSMIYNNFLILTLPVAAMFFIFSGQIINFIFGSKYLVVTTALKIYLVFWIFIFLRQVNLVFLASIGEAKYSSKMLWIEVIFNVVAAVILIKLFDYTGAVFAAGSGAILITILTYSFLRKKIAIKIDYWQQLKTLVAGALFMMVAMYLEDRIFITIGKLSVFAEGIIVLAISGIVYLSALTVMKVVTKNKIIYFKKLLIQQSP